MLGLNSAESVNIISKLIQKDSSIKFNNKIIDDLQDQEIKFIKEKIESIEKQLISAAHIEDNNDLVTICHNIKDTITQLITNAAIYINQFIIEKGPTFIIEGITYVTALSGYTNDNNITTNDSSSISLYANSNETGQIVEIIGEDSQAIII